MKIQVESQALRVRISEAELAQLQAGDTLSNTTQLTPELSWTLRLTCRPGDNWSLISDGALQIGLPDAALNAYVARLPCRDGLHAELAIENGNTLNIEFAVDVRDSVRQRGPRSAKAR